MVGREETEEAADALFRELEMEIKQEKRPAKREVSVDVPMEIEERSHEENRKMDIEKNGGK